MTIISRRHTQHHGRTTGCLPEFAAAAIGTVSRATANAAGIMLVWKKLDGWSLREGFIPVAQRKVRTPQGKRCRLTAGRGDPTESATETYRRDAFVQRGKGEMVR